MPSESVPGKIGVKISSFFSHSQQDLKIKPADVYVHV